MASLLKYNFQGKQLAEKAELDQAIIQPRVNEALVKQCVVALRENQRQWSASTQGRSDVRCTGKKPHKQKGTGGARQGSLAAPQYRGGGVVFGPKPKFNQYVAVNSKQRRLALQQLLSERVRDGKVAIVETPVFKNDKPSTKIAHAFLEKMDLFNKNVLILGKESNLALELSLRNICNDKRGEKKKLSYKRTANLNVYNVAIAEHIILVDAVEEFKSLLQHGFLPTNN